MTPDHARRIVELARDVRLLRLEARRLGLRNLAYLLETAEEEAAECAARTKD